MQVPAVYVLPGDGIVASLIWFENPFLLVGETSLHLEPLLGNLKRMWKHKHRPGLTASYPRRVLHAMAMPNVRMAPAKTLLSAD